MPLQSLIVCDEGAIICINNFICLIFSLNFDTGHRIIDYYQTLLLYVSVEFQYNDALINVLPLAELFNSQRVLWRKQNKQAYHYINTLFCGRGAKDNVWHACVIFIPYQLSFTFTEEKLLWILDILLFFFAWPTASKYLNRKVGLFFWCSNE